MTIKAKTTMDHIKSASLTVQDHPLLGAALKVGFFVWHYFEMMLAMMVGSAIFDLLVSFMPGPTRYSVGLRPGTYLYGGGVAISMMFVMVAWMVVRGHGWRHSAEMSIAMLVPVALVAGISTVNGGPAWFDDTYCSAMCVGMVAAMAFRWNHFTHWSFRSSHHHH